MRSGASEANRGGRWTGSPTNHPRPFIPTGSMHTAKRPNIGLTGPYACITNKPATTTPHGYSDTSTALHPPWRAFSLSLSRIIHEILHPALQIGQRYRVRFHQPQRGKRTFALFRKRNIGTHSLGCRWKPSRYERRRLCLCKTQG